MLLGVGGLARPKGLRSARDSAGAAAAIHDVGTLQTIAKWDMYMGLRHYIQVCKLQPGSGQSWKTQTLAQFTHYLFVLWWYTAKVMENVDLAR
jgi:hypothetical protein